MKLYRHALPLAAAILLLPNALAVAGDWVQVEDAYARAVPPGQPNSAVFMSLTNTGSEDGAVTGAESDVSEVVELHTHIVGEDMMRMRKVERINLPAGETVTLKPGGLHVMLIGLKSTLAPGDLVGLTLIYEDDSRTDLIVPVKRIEHSMQHEHHHGE